MAKPASIDCAVKRAAFHRGITVRALLCALDLPAHQHTNPRIIIQRYVVEMISDMTLSGVLLQVNAALAVVIQTLNKHTMDH